MDQVRLDWDWGLSTKLVFGDWTLRHLQLDGPSVPSPALSVSWWKQAERMRREALNDVR